ncbi:MAG: hypothetical protein LBO73_04395 [Holosporaceae bacterium]|jgi:hypothetical protein|nr:hypothetical protein [Holosporaceae bacterium]
MISKDGVRVFVDSYLDYMDTFFGLVNDPTYNEIIGSLFKNPLRIEGRYGIMNDLWDTILAIDHIVTDNPEKRALLTYVVLKTDQIFEKHNVLEKAGRSVPFFPTYKALMMDKSYKESPLYLSIEEEISKMLSKGAVINFNEQE